MVIDLLKEIPYDQLIYNIVKCLINREETLIRQWAFLISPRQG